jgi:hypothetical protein
MTAFGSKQHTHALAAQGIEAITPQAANTCTISEAYKDCVAAEE